MSSPAEPMMTKRRGLIAGVAYAWLLGSDAEPSPLEVATEA
jgi:hypothetical protein